MCYSEIKYLVIILSGAVVRMIGGLLKRKL